jgi:hypothetical protein
MYSDANGGDPDSTSPTLRKYHKLLWSKALPNGKIFELTDNKSGAYLYHKSEIGEFFLGSDAITHSYKHHKRKAFIVQQLQNDVQELFDLGSTVGGYIIFPNNRIEGNQTINQARGVNGYIDDRFDLTLECIRRFYIGQKSPLFDVLNRYKYFFDLFVSFREYVDYFLLNDLINKEDQIRFYLPFNHFSNKPFFNTIDDYLLYKERVISFIQQRNNRIKENMSLAS